MLSGHSRHVLGAGDGSLSNLSPFLTPWYPEVSRESLAPSSPGVAHISSCVPPKSADVSCNTGLQGRLGLGFNIKAEARRDPTSSSLHKAGKKAILSAESQLQSQAELEGLHPGWHWRESGLGQWLAGWSCLSVCIVGVSSWHTQELAYTLAHILPWRDPRPMP